MLTATLLLAAMRPDNFSTRLWNALPPRSGNVVVSPTSLEACLGLLIDGVGPQSRAPLAKTFGVTPEGLQAFDGTLQGRLRALQSEEITISNAGFFTSPPSPMYATAISKGYGATAERLTGLPQINGWVNEHTKGRIPKLLDRLDPKAEAVLLNAVTFDGDWTKAFDASKTKKEPFAAPSGSRPVDTMHEPKGRFAYGKGTGFGLVALPYKGDRYRMVVMLPDSGDPTRLLRDDAWRTALKGANTASVDFSIPRFTVRSEPAVEPALKAMGLDPLFRSIDFRPAVPSGTVRLISEIVQRTYVKVDEKGTQAAAATGVVMTRAAFRPQTPVVFHVDRPFAFVIEHVATGEPLFMGVIREP